MTTIVFDAAQFGAALCLILFMFFFYIGYREEKRRSAGAFLLVSGFLLLGLSVGSYASIPVIIVGIVLAVSIFIILIGINKWFFKPANSIDTVAKK